MDIVNIKYLYDKQLEIRRRKHLKNEDSVIKWSADSNIKMCTCVLRISLIFALLSISVVNNQQQCILILT